LSKPDLLIAAGFSYQVVTAHNRVLESRRSAVTGITHSYLNVGRIEGGSNTNVVPGKVVLRLDRRMIPEEDAASVEAELRSLIEQTVAQSPGVRLEIKRLLLAQALQPQTGNAPLVAAIQKHGQAEFGEPTPPRVHRCTPTCACTARVVCRR
jgi:acetylornithine deacetylase/succinyl-diaminopimelate desuccinylase-like protein